MRKSDNTIAIQAMMPQKEKNVGEFEKPNCDARSAAIAPFNQAFMLLVITLYIIAETTKKINLNMQNQHYLKSLFR